MGRAVSSFGIGTGSFKWAPRASAAICFFAVALPAWLLMGAAPALSFSYTPITPSPEPTQADILGLIYGGTFLATGSNYSNGSIDALRVWDTDGGNEIIDIVVGDENDIDQIWTDGTAYVTAEAKYASLSQSFGWNEGGDTAVPSDYRQLLHEGDVGGPPVPLTVNGDFLWGIQPNGDTWWSRENQNSDAVDHLVTYKINGLGDAATVWALFWEDLPAIDTDSDFNDFVIEVRAIPEPGTALLLGFGLALLAVHPRRS
jgi:hypothetical protein